MTDKLKITKTDGNVTILHLEGDINKQTEGMLLSEAQAVLDSGKRWLVIDLKQVGILSSAGLHTLHSIYKMFTSSEDSQKWQAEHVGETFKSPSFKLAEPPPQVHYVLSIAGFLQNIYIFPSLQEALDSF